MEQVTAWLGAPRAVLIGPTPRYADVLLGLLAGSAPSYDTESGRFDGVRWQTPRDVLASETYSHKTAPLHDVIPCRSPPTSWR